MAESQKMASRLAVTAVQRTLAGLKARNEDCIAIQIPWGASLATKGVVAVIADGVSAAEAGREAAEIAVQGFVSDYYSTPDSWSVKQSAHRVLTALNRWLYGQGQRFFTAEKGYVTTFSALIFKSCSAYVFHVGDSRIYRYRAGVLKQLTRDHVTRISAQQCYLGRALGMDVNLDVDFRTLELQAGDIFLLTTDGVHEFVSDRQMQQMLDEDTGNLDTLADRLIHMALDNGSHDNLSCQCVRIDAPGAETSADILQALNRLPFPPDLDVGMKLDGWQIQEWLHASPRSQLYRVRHADSGQLAVMKTPSRHFCDDAAYIERFILEEWVARRIDNPHVVKTVEPPQRRTFLYYLLEPLDGPTLAQQLEKGPLDIAATVTLAEGLVHGLRAFHRRETLHQDLKPDNILLRNGQPVIVDFGSVRVAGVDEIVTRTARETPLGTLEYSAPEYRLPQPRTEAGDQFSLALILYEALTGQQPYGRAYALAQTAKDFLALQYVPAWQHNPLVPLWMDGALHKALQIPATARYDALSEFIHDLKHPNPEFLRAAQAPLLERNPLRLWQLVCALLLTANLVLALLLSQAMGG